MRLFIKYENNNNLSDISDLVKKMWKENINFSIVADAVELKNCTTLTLAWDKWLDDDRWISHPKAKEYIYFDLIKEPSPPYKMKMEIEDDAIQVDKCAFYKAAVFIAEKTQGRISVNGKTWLEIEDYAETINEYLKLSFDEAVELSLLEYKY